MLLTRFVQNICEKTVRKCIPLIQSSRIKLENYSRVHTFAPLNVKLFFDKENQYAHNILQQSNLYNIFKEPDVTVQSGTSLDNIEDIVAPDESCSETEIVENFKKLTLYCKETGICITNEKFDRFVDVFTTKCHQFSDEQLIECLKYLYLLPETPGVRVRNFLELWSALDSACVDRIEKWSVDELLLCCDYWYGLHLARPCELVWHAIRKIGRKIRKLNPQQLVHTMFFCNIVRKAVFEMFDFEVVFNECIDSLSINEIGVMCMGFFKTSTPIRNPELVEKIYKRIMQETDSVEDITLVNVLKILRYSSKIPQAGLMNELLDKLSTQIERLSLLSCLHIALLGTDIHHAHEKSVMLIVRRFNRHIKEARLKDMERITFAMSLFDFSTSAESVELCQKVLGELKNRVEEIVRYPRCFPNCLHFLSLLGHYDEELLSGVLEEKFIKHAYGSNILLGREIFCLDSFARINLKGKYSKNLLTEKRRKTMGKCLSHYIPERNSKFRLSLTDRILLEIKETCESLYRPCYLKHVLPHFQRPDVVIIYDKVQKKVLALSKDCPPDYTGSILTKDLLLDRDSGHIKTIVVVAAGWNNFVRNTNKPTGVFNMKLKQLELLGHEVAVIPWHEWRNLETTTDRHEYMRRVLSPMMCR